MKTPYLDQYIKVLEEDAKKGNNSFYENCKLREFKKIKKQLALLRVVARLFPHKHKWQVRGRNRFGSPTYRICLKCRKTYQRVNKSWEDERWEECEAIDDLDSQFDSKDKFIFK